MLPEEPFNLGIAFQFTQEKRSVIVNWLKKNDPNTDNHKLYESGGSDLLLPASDLFTHSEPQRVRQGDYISLTRPFLVLTPLEVAKFVFIYNTIEAARKTKDGNIVQDTPKPTGFVTEEDISSS